MSETASHQSESVQRSETIAAASKENGKPSKKVAFDDSAIDLKKKKRPRKSTHVGKANPKRDLFVFLVVIGILSYFAYRTSDIGGGAPPNKQKKTVPKVKRGGGRFGRYRSQPNKPKKVDQQKPPESPLQEYDEFRELKELVNSQQQMIQDQKAEIKRLVTRQNELDSKMKNLYVADKEPHQDEL